ncbi:leucyl aminopeptidase [Candidatus Gottesmanbacteria bacterium]|nr:leucyl aminopeptidase [Candidatus Gottesmanbacteria bacterium]
MKFLLKPTDPSKIEADILISFCWEKDLSETSDISKELSEEVKEGAAREDFEGKSDQLLLLSTRGIISAYKFLLVGLGKREKFDSYHLYTAIASAVKKSREGKPAKIAIVLPSEWLKKFSTPKTVQAVVEAVSASLYQFLKYKSEEEKKKTRIVEEVDLLLSAGKLSAAEEGLQIGEIISASVSFARDLINEPGEVTHPSFLAETALDIAKASKGSIKVKVWEKEEIEKLGMGSFLGVAKGSVKPPKFIRLSYRPALPKKKIVLIGKGITFDTGGLSIKTAEFMETMKLDMSGAASVLSIFQALPSLHPKVEVVGLIAACENMPAGNALKPGDILSAMNGKTIEVLNTDAEGRLTLADAISFANMKEKPDEIIDIATLTGACMVALGQEIAGLWGNDEKMMQDLERSAKETCEKIWRMPLEEEYKELLKSHIADIKNIQTGKYGGAITGALFLSEFVGSTPWMHLDIAGPAYAEKDTALAPQGGVGFGVRLLLHYLLNK